MNGRAMHNTQADRLPPEKYYEACITYHIVNYYREKHIGDIFPFSISQSEEHEKGYDFEYRLDSERIFYIQYKRPDRLAADNHALTWTVNICQLLTIIENGLGDRAYYALPGFFDFREWYSGLEKTYFLNADDLYTQLRLMRKTKQQTAIVSAKSWRLKSFEDYFAKQNAYKNILLRESTEEQEQNAVPGILGEDFTGYMLCKKRVENHRNIKR